MSDNHSVLSHNTSSTGGPASSSAALSTNSLGSSKNIPFRRLSLPHPCGADGEHDTAAGGESDNSTHFLPALQVIAHVLIPLRKALIHFHFLCKQNPDQAKSKIEFECLSKLGQIFQAMVTAPTQQEIDESLRRKKEEKDSDDEDSDDDEDEEGDEDVDIESALPPIDPTPFYQVLVKCLVKFQKPTKPKDATEALQVLLEVIQQSCRQIPVTSHLWSALIDQAGLGIVAKQSTVGQCDLEEDGEILQRTIKESVILWCPWKLPLQPTLPLAIQKACSKTPSKQSYDFDNQPYDFEVRIPLWQKPPAPAKEFLDGSMTSWDSSAWRTTKSLQLTSLTTFLFLAIDRYNKDGSINTSEVEIPKILDISKVCASTTRTSASSQRNTKSRQYELVAGILVDDEEDYVAILKNFAITDPEDEHAWKLMESEEVIPMTESDVLDFLKGEGSGNDGNEDEEEDEAEDEGGAPCGTVLVYQRCDEQQNSTNEMNQILSDIIISHVSGTLDTANDSEYYYEEEIIED